MVSIRKIVLRGIAVLGSFLIGLVLVEVGLRLVASPSPDAAAEAASDEARRPPRVGRHDRVFGDAARPTAREGVWRILIVGDSFTWGSGVEAHQAYPRQLERRLNEGSPADRVEVVAWSRPGWNTVQEVRATLPMLPDLDPDLLILGFCLNDVEPSRKRTREREQAPLVRRRPVGGVPSLLYQHSALFRLAFDRLENTRQRRAFDRYYENIYSPRRSLTEAVEALRAFSRAAEARGIPALLVILPVFDSPLEQYHYREIHRRVASLATDAGWSVLDLLSAYEGLDARQLVVEPFTNPHPSPKGHRVAAAAIHRYILESGWIPRKRPGSP